MWGKLWTQECAILANKYFSPLSDMDFTSSEAAAALSRMVTADESDGNSWLRSGIHEATVTGESMTAILPSLMHFAIVLFTIGLVVFVWSDTVLIGCLLLVFFVVGLIAYFVSARLRRRVWYRFLLVHLRNLIRTSKK